MHTEQRLTAHYLLLSLAVLFISACGDEETGEPTYAAPPVFGAVDPSMTCQPGYVGWDFATGGGIEALPKPIKIKSIDCDDAGEPKKPADQGQGVRQQCQGSTACSFVEKCEKVSVKWTCGDEATEFKRDFKEGRGSLSCYVAGNSESGAADLALSKGKACVPKTCPNNTFRDERLHCVTAAKHKPGWFAFGPPTAIPLQRTSANPSLQRLVGDTEYYFVTSLARNSSTDGIPQGRLEFWFADEYQAKGGSLPPVQGFRCSAAQAYVSASTVYWGFVIGAGPPVGSSGLGQPWVLTRTFISPQCTASAAADGAQRDAARRAGMSLADFKSKYSLQRLRLHASFDLEGQTVLDSAVESAAVPQDARGCLPRPPGFFYHPGASAADSYVDMIAYYQQREITAYSGGNLETGWDLPSNVRTSFRYLAPAAQWGNYSTGVSDRSGAPFGATAAEHPTRIRMSAKSFLVSTPELEIAKYGNVQPRINVAVEHTIAGGENASNPYGFKGPSVEGAKSLKQRRLRADVYMHPADKPAFVASEAVLIGSVDLGDSLPTGTMTNGVVSISKRNRRRFFEEWKDKDNYKVFYCLGADGLDTLSGRTLDLPLVKNAGLDYSAGIDSDEYVDGNTINHRCTAADTIMVIHRDESRRPLDPAALTADLESAADNSSGDSNTQGSQGMESEKSCSGGSCSMTDHAEMALFGSMGGTIFESESTTRENNADDGSGSVEMGAHAEALGFTILEMPSDGTGEWAGGVDLPNTKLAFSISPEWGAIEDAIDEALSGTSVDAKTGRYSGRDGLGIAFGYKVVLAGPVPGVVNVGVSAGVGLSIDLEVSLKPANDYSCIKAAGSSAKCYLVLEDATTQDDARGACAQLGGYLAEVRTADDLSNLRTVLADETGLVWMGGQQAYEYIGGSCAENPDSTCVAQAKLNYRWLSDDESFATATGSGAVVIGLVSPLGSNDINLSSQLPTETAVAYNTGTDRFVLRATNQQLRGVCQFDPAQSYRYLRFAGGLSLGVGAGLGLSFCTPTEDFGVCLEGSINFVALGVQFVKSHEMYTLTRSIDGRKNRIGGTGTDVPWKLSFLSGSIVAKFNFWLFSVSATILNWDGFTAAQGSLFDQYVPVVEKAP